MSEVQFTYEWYESLLRRFVESGYSFEAFDAAPADGTVFLRHDVDWSPRKARRMAHLEAELGVSSTYCFLLSTPFYNLWNGQNRELVEEIRSLGHQVALHFSTHQYWDDRPGAATLTDAVETELDVLSTLVGTTVDTVSFHNPPEWVLGESFEAFRSTYAPQYFEKVPYRGDSDQRWRSERPFGEELPETVQVLTHPVLWGDRDAWVTDRLREEREHQFERIDRHLTVTDEVWADEVVGDHPC